MIGISLVFAGVMLVLPFLYSFHARPLTAFYQEWWAAALGLAATPILATRRFWLQARIPKIVILPIGLLLLGAIQFGLGRITYSDQLGLLILYLSWAGMLMILGQYLVKELGLPAVATVLAIFLLVGCEMNALAGILQHYRWHTFLDSMVTTKIGAGVYGNLAQPNHFANYITLGLVSLGLLHMRKFLRIWHVALLSAPLLFVLVLSGSRSVWLYLLLTLGVAWRLQRRDRSSARLLGYTIFLLLGFCLMHAIVQIPWLDGPGGSITTIRPLLDEGSSGHIRIYLWREAWQIFSRFPILGAGFGHFAWQHFESGPVFQNTHIVGLYNNAHSLIMQVAAEMGFTGLVILLWPIIKWLTQLGHAQHTPYHWWAISILGVLAIHSLLEYPLWYTYFLGIAALTLGMLDTTTYRLRFPALGHMSACAMILVGALLLIHILQNYRNLEMLTDLQKSTNLDGRRFWHLPEGRLAAHTHVPLRPYFDLLMSNRLEINADNLPAKRIQNEKIMYFAPISTVAYREAFLLALSGKQAAARLQMERAIWSYPNDFHTAYKELIPLAQKNPGIFAALLKFALQKFEERQRAVHTR